VRVMRTGTGGLVEGAGVGLCVGAGVGLCVGAGVGLWVGAGDGLRVGAWVGLLVGAWVGAIFTGAGVGGGRFTLTAAISGILRGSNPS